MELLAVGFRFLLVDICYRDRLSKSKLAASCERRDTASMDGLGATSGKLPLFGLPATTGPALKLGRLDRLNFYYKCMHNVEKKKQFKNI
jgi:hypothetical protein